MTTSSPASEPQSPDSQGPKAILEMLRPRREWALALAPTVAPIVVGAVLGSAGAGFKVAYAVLILALFGYIWALRARPVVLIVGLLVWLTLERLVVAILSPVLDATTFTWLLAYKEFFFPFLFVVGLPQAGRVWQASSRTIRFVDVAAVAFGVAIVLAIILSGATLDHRITYARRFAELPLVYLAARLLPIRAAQVRAIVVAIIVVAVPVAIFGYLERSVLESLIWRDIAPAADYYHLSVQSGLAAWSDQEHIWKDMPFGFWVFGFGDPFRRLVSTYLEATTLAMYLAFAGVLALAIWPKKWLTYVVVAILAGATVLTIGKAGMLVFAVAGAYALLARVRPELRRPSTVVGLAGLIAVLVLAGSGLMVLFGVWSGALAHVRGLKEGLDSAASAPLGYGLGYGGDFGIGQSGAESTLGVMLVQIGLPGAAVWLAWLIGLALACAYAAKRGALGFVSLTLAVTTFAFLVTAVFTESAGGLLGNWPYALLPALILSASSGAGASVAAEETVPIGD